MTREESHNGDEVEKSDKMKKTLYLFSGEGTRSRETGSKLFKYSSRYAEIDELVGSLVGESFEDLWDKEVDRHAGPYSPLLTVVSQICLADLWSHWGFRPDVVLGHSTGELAASFTAGFYSLETVLKLALQLGEVAARLEGTMVHGTVTDAEETDLDVTVSSRNFLVDGGKHITLSGYAKELETFLDGHPGFVRMKLPHPWHHPDYERFAHLLAPATSAVASEPLFISGITAEAERRLDDDYWRRWLVSPVDFIESMRAAGELLGDHSIEVIEIGSHPVLEKSCSALGDFTHVSSMYRGEDDVSWIIRQRKMLDQKRFRERVSTGVAAYKPQIELDQPLSHQGLDSTDFVNLVEFLSPFLPTLEPQDFYKYRTIDQLLERFGTTGRNEKSHRPLARGRDNEVVVAGMSCRLPSSIETPAQFWDTLLGKDDQVRLEPGRGQREAGYLSQRSTRFDHQFFGISKAEAVTMDPQQILALELTEMLFRDAGVAPDQLDRSRVGVYLGVWNQEYRGERSSVYYPTGTNPSIIASRISHHYDLRGPSWVSNTACSSSLVAVHYAAKDIEAGRVDYAIAGGVNMLVDETFSTSMRSSGFLSPSDRCKAFDDSADGYVRAEGGGLVLLVNKALVERYYAELEGSSINQNGGRSQVITAPNPDAQEELIRAACADADIAPSELGYIECHGTGTKLGDPIEASALQNLRGTDGGDVCYLGSVKSNIGHLESAAGIAGLIKCVASLNHGVIPPNLHLHRSNQFIDFESYHLEVVTSETAIDREAYCGVSSFGFGGSNAHVIVKGADDAARKELREVEVPFDRERAASIDGYLQLEVAPNTSSDEPREESTNEPLTRQGIEALVTKLFFELTSIDEIDAETELSDQGLDSMSGTELLSKLEASLGIDLEPEIIFENPLLEQFVDEVFSVASAA